MKNENQIAIIIPAYNEEKTIASVVREYKLALPEAVVYVGDNNSIDETAQRAKEAGASIIRCELQGKGNAVRKMFELIDADIYIMIDADENRITECSMVFFDILTINDRTKMITAALFTIRPSLAN